MKYIKTYKIFERIHKISQPAKKIYPLKDIEPFINWFNSMYGKLAERQGWSVYSSDTSMTSWKYPVWQVEKNDDTDILKDDTESDNLAKKLGLMLDDMGVVIGYNGVSFIEHPEELEQYKNITKYNF